MPKERQAKPVPSVWPKNGPLGTLFLTHGLAWMIHGLWRHTLIDFLASLDTGRNADRASAAALMFHNIPRFWRSDSHKKIPARCYSELLHRIAGRLSILRRSTKTGAAFPLISSLPSPINQSLFFTALPRRPSWPYRAIRCPGPEKFPLAYSCLVAIGEGTG